MALRTKLIETKVEKRDYLSTQFIRSLETLRVEHDSCNHVLIRLCHSYLAEELLQIIWQLGTSSIIRIHCNENSHVWVQFDISSHEINSLSELF